MSQDHRAPHPADVPDTAQGIQRDSRRERLAAGPERELLEAFLDFQRDTLLWKVSGLTDDQLRSIATPVCVIWGQDDAYGEPEIGRRATELMPRARLEVMSGNHAPFLDHPERCAALIMHAVEGERVALCRWRAGFGAPRHTHADGEELFVLEGSFEDELVCIR